MAAKALQTCLVEQFTVRCILNTEELDALTPRCTLLLSQKHKKCRLQYAQSCKAMEHNWTEGSLVCLEVEDWSRRWKELPSYCEAWRHTLELLCFIRYWKPAVRGRQDGLNQVNPRCKCHAICEEAGAKAPLDHPAGQLSQAHCSPLRLGFMRSHSHKT